MARRPQAADVGLGSAYRSVREFTESLAAPLSAEDQTIQSMPDVSPTKWHRAHTTWFFETFVLEPNRPGYAGFDPAFGYLFNSYYEAVGARHPRNERGLISRPGIVEIAAYRAHVDSAMASLLDDAEALEAVAGLVTLGLHHEQQHQELLLMDIKHVLSTNPLRPAYQLQALDPGALRVPGWTTHEGGVVEIGATGDGFHFDNESPRHKAWTDPYELADQPVTCGEWLAFIDDGGYHRPELWLSEGWATVNASGWEAPLHWYAGREGWDVFRLTGIGPVDPSEPVCHVSYFEADAFARWAGARLPTEVEWEHAVAAGGGVEDAFGLHPRSGRPPGQVWEWTASAYLPYPGFAPAAGAVGEYNGKFMVNQHVLRGACCVTPPGHARLTYRNFFPPSARWAFSGLRLARS